MKLRRNSWFLILALAANPVLGQVKSCTEGEIIDPASPDAAAAASAAAAATADEGTFLRGVDRCPTLPSASQFTWTYHDGPDFGVCYGAKEKTPTPSFGVYLGNFPSFNPKNGIAIEQGAVAGHDVIWYKQDASDDDSPFSRQTLVVFCRDQNYTEAAHVWLGAATKEELEIVLSILEHMTFKQ